MKSINTLLMTGFLCLVVTASSQAYPVQELAKPLIEDISIPLDDAYQTDGQFIIPDGASNVVILFHGSGPYDMDATVPDFQGGVYSSNFKLLAESLSDQGIATLRYHKRGVLGGGHYDQAEMMKANSLSQLVSDAEAVLNVAIQKGFDHVYLYGWSEGAWVASHVAARRPNEIAGVVLQGPPNGSLAEVLKTQHLQTGVDYLTKVVDADKDGLLMISELVSIPQGPVSLMSQFYFWDPSSSPVSPKINARTDSNGDGFIDIKSELVPTIEQTIAMMGAYPSPLSTSTSDVLEESDVPVLILHGEMDGWVGVDQGAEIARSLGDRVRLHTYPNLGHALSITKLKAEDGFGKMALKPVEDMASWIVRK